MKQILKSDDRCPLFSDTETETTDTTTTVDIVFVFRYDEVTQGKDLFKGLEHKFEIDMSRCQKADT